MKAVEEEVRRHIRLLRTVSCVSWLLGAFLLYLSSLLPLFDSSPRVLLDNTEYSFPTSALLRWDVFHFGHIALEGYVYEYEWAFLPGTPFVMNAISQLFKFVGLSNSTHFWSQVVVAGALAACGTGTATTLYDLTLVLTKSTHFALLSSLLSLLPSSPVTLRYVPYTEPFFTYLSYRGMLFCARSQWFLAACSFSLASAFRSNGIMLGGFIIWGLLLEPAFRLQKVALTQVLKATILTAVIFAPFIYHQYAAYTSFCFADTPRPWCSQRLPLIYSYVQKQYWNSGGFLSYWTLSQLPNFLLSAPVLVLLLWSSSLHIRTVFLSPIFKIPKPSCFTKTGPLTPSLTPHAIHTIIFTSILLFASHTQIVLRLAASMPFTYWSAAYLVVVYPQWGRRWVTWSIVWGAVSIVLWSVFLPPA
ncbi:GPI mannosyltransferase 2 [Abortiporus biennis]|nr:GPI mannosyltransferase 2 [Abortiporus biennis]